MLLSYRQTIWGLADAIAREQAGSVATPTDAVVAFIEAAHARAPDYLRVALGIGVLAFDASAYLTNGRPFHRLGPDLRASQIASWERSPVGACRSLMLFFRSLGLFRLYATADAVHG